MQAHLTPSIPRLLGDIGGTHARFALVMGDGSPITHPVTLATSDAACEEALERMCCLLGSTAANLALTLGARGGIYIGGGVIARLGDYFSRSGFRAAFESKGRFENYLQRIPTYVIRAEQPTLIGCAMALGLPTTRR
jgi:glucokinase